MHFGKISLPFFIFGILSLCAFSQTRPVMGINGIVASMDTLRSRIPAEKLYIHFDKPYYSTGDTIWFKAYLFDAAFLTGSLKSGIVYVELANDTNKVLLQRMLPVTAGLGRGNIVLNKEEIPEGSYTIRAYTNLMRNFGSAASGGEDKVFKKSFYVSGSTAQDWLVHSNTILSKASGENNLRLGLQFNQFNGKALAMRQMDIRVLDGKRVLLRDKVQTDIDGMMDVNFDIPENADGKKISIIAEDPGALTAYKVVIPIPVNRTENTDLQFMPEGGSLVAGVSSVVGFKAIGEDGKGVEVKGKVYSSSGSEEVAVFSSLHKGMGSFELKPKASESYTARVIFSDGTTKNYALPLVKNSGTALRITNPKESDSIEVTISIPSDLLTATSSPATATSSSAAATFSPPATVPKGLPGATSSSATYYLIAQSRGVICYGAIVRFNGANINQRKIAKNLFPSGIARFTLLSADRQPVNERMIFIDHQDNLNITVTPAKSSYKTRDSIALTIKVNDKNGNPVQGSFSLAVTDDNQIRTDSLGNSMLTSLLLTSDLKGTIEDPGYYFQTADAAWAALDNLLLTQGWTGYQWKDVFNPPAIAPYSAEPEFVVHGRVSNAFNKSLAGTPIQLFSSRPGFFMNAITDIDGTFTFSKFPPADSLRFFIQAKNKNDKSNNIGVNVDEFKPAVFRSDNQRFIPWYVNSDTTLLKYVKTAAIQKEEQIKFQAGVNVLNEVTITAKKIVKDSKNLNGLGNADMILDEKDMEKAKKVTLFNILEQRLTGFHKTYPTEVPYHSSINSSFRMFAAYAAYQRPVKLIIDGVFIDQMMGQDDEFFMDFLNAEDIKGVEIMSSSKNMDNYFMWEPNKPPLATSFTLAKIPYMGHVWQGWGPAVYIEITTWSGHGAWMQKTPGTYLYKPMPFAGTQQFYRPKYTVKTGKVTLADLRSTIHWEPDIITDKDGKAFVSFYSADKPGTYSIITEGSDMNGNLGSKINSIFIKP